MKSFNKKETLKDKTAKGLAWGGISNVIQPIIGMTFGIFLGRILNSDDYGLIGMLSIFTGFAGIIVNGGFTSALTNKRDAGHRDYNAVFWFAVAVAVIIYFILFASAPLIAMFYDKPSLTFVSRILFLSIPVSAMSISSNVIIYKNLKSKLQAKINIASMFLSGVAGISAALAGMEYWALVFQQLTFIVGGSAMRFLTTPWRPTFSFDFSPLKEMFTFSSKVFFANLIFHVNANISSVILGKLFDTAQFGYYVNANKWTKQGEQSINGMMAQIVQPVIVQVNNDKKRELKVFRKMLRFTAFVACPAFFGFALIAREFILITVTAKWANSIPIMQLLCVGGICSPFYVLYSQLLLSHGKSSTYMKGIVVMSIIMLTILFLYTFGMLYIVAAFVVAMYACVIYWQHVCSKIIDLTLSRLIGDLFPYFIITVVAAAAAFVAAMSIHNLYLSLVVKIIVMGAVYLSLLWFCGSKILKESVMMITGKLK